MKIDVEALSSKKANNNFFIQSFQHFFYGLSSYK